MRHNFIGKFVETNRTFVTQSWFQNHTSSFNSISNYGMWCWNFGAETSHTAVYPNNYDLESAS